MPTYQYACTACGHQLEAVQSFTDEPLTECPACEGKLRKQFSAVGIVFKGSGFYRNDSRSTSKSASPATTDSSSSDSNGGEATKAAPEGKPKPTESAKSDKKPASPTKAGSTKAGSTKAGSTKAGSTTAG